MTTELWWIDTGYACAGVTLEDGVCTAAAPIFKWMLGKTEKQIRSWKKIKELHVIWEE